LFYNEVTVTARPRTLSAGVEVLGTLEKAVKIPAGQSKEINFRYSDPATGAKVAGEAAVTPVGGSDYHANAAEDGSGADVTGSVSAAMTEDAAARGTVQFTNASAADGWLLAGAQLRGLKITDYGAIDTRRSDSESKRVYGPRSYTYEFELDDVAEAENMAEFLLLERYGPRGRVVDLKLAALSNGLTEQAVTRTIGDRIAVIEAQTNIHAGYFIIGEQHQLSHGSDYRVTWTLEPSAAYQYWELGLAGFSEVGLTTYLA
jgi:hypothetical protein